MKQNKLFKLWLLAVILFAGSGVTWGQTITLSGWDFNSLSAYGSSPLTPSSSAANLTIVGLTRGTGITTSGTAAGSAWGGTGMDNDSEANAITGNDFIFFSITANSGYSLSINSINAYNIRRSSTGPTTGQWQYKVGSGSFTDIGTDITWGTKTSSSGNSQAAIDLSGISALQGVSAGTTVTFRCIVWGASASTGTWYLNNFQAGNDFVIDVTVNSTSSTPTITITETSLSDFTYVQGSGPSSEQTFKLSGSNLTNDISVSAPTNYEISNTSGSGFTSSLTFTQSGGTVAEQTVYVRLKAGLSAGNYNSEVITASSTGATNKTVTCSGTVTAQPVTPGVIIALTSGSNPACAGSSVSFTASPSNTGGGTVSYQWKVNGNNTGTNNAVFTSSTLQNNDQISCVITITGGNVTANTATSASITMTVNPLPTTPVAGNNGPVCVGSTLQLTSNATGTISWTGPNGFTSTQQNPEITNVTAAAAGTYYVTSNNGTCTSLAGSTVVTINAATSIATQPANATVTVGSSKTFNVVASGSGLTYQWKLNGINITNATGDSYTVSNVTLAMSGNVYSVVVTGDCGSPVISDNATLTVVELPCGGTESFTNSSISASYSSGSFTGDVVLWSYVYSRNEESFGITGKGCMFGQSNTAKLTSGSLSGIGNFTCKLKKGFTGLGTRQVGLYINGELKGNSIAWDNTTTQTFTVNNINVAGNVVIEIRNLTSYQVVVDDISWTCYAPPAAPLANNGLNITTTGFTANWNTVSGATSYKLDVSTQNPFSSDFTLIDENFVNFTGNGTSVTELDSYMNLTGWTGSQVYTYNSAARLGSGSNRGILTTPTIDLSNAESIKLTFDLGEYGTDASSIEVLHAADGSTFNSVTTIVAPSSMTTQIVYITGGTANSKIRIQAITDANERFYLDNFKVVKTVSNCIAGYKDVTVNALTQAVTGLANHTNYYYRVRAVGANGTSANSNVITVYTGENYRSKTNGNWNDVGTWEVSSDTNTWDEASVVPAIGAANISIGNGHLITVTENASADLVTIQPTGKLTVNDGITLTSPVTLQSDATGTATVMGAVTGTATVNQAVTAPRTYYMGLPVSVSPEITGITGISKFNIVTDTWSDIATQNTAFDTTGVGYLVQVAVGSATNISFKGTLNSGSIEAPFSTANRRFNYYGNPYPSFLETNKVITAAGSNIDPSIWFYSKGSGSYAFTTYNNITAETLPSTADGVVIPPMQGFWLRAKTSATATSFTFTDEMRLHKPETSTAIFKAPKAAASSKLNLTISNGTVADETLVLFNEAAQTGFDVYDSEKMMNSAPSLNIFTIIGDQKLAMNGMPAVMYDTEIPLGVNVPAGTYTISAIRFANFAEGEKVQLIDKATNTLTDISATDYTFAVSEALNNTSRFALVFPSKVGTSVNRTEMSISNVYVSDGRIVVNVTKSVQGNLIEVYNSVGQRIASQAITGSSNRIEKQLNSGVYIVKVNAESTKVIIK